MSLSSPLGPAPFEPVGRHTDVALPERVRYWEPWPRRMRAILDGRTVVDSRRAVMLWQTGSFPDLYYPRADIDAERIDRGLLSPAPSAGEHEGELAGYVRIDFAAMDAGSKKTSRSMPTLATRTTASTSGRHRATSPSGTASGSSPTRHDPSCCSRPGIRSVTTCRSPTSISPCSRAATRSPSAPTRVTGSTGT